jgi:hypothetical protein
MTNIPASIAENVGNGRKLGVWSRSREGVAGMMTMLVADVAIHAEIEVIASSASDKLLFGMNCWSQYGLMMSGVRSAHP